MLEYLEKNKIKLLYIPLLVYWMILLTATSLPGNELPKTGINDKIEHFSAYLVLSLFLAFVLRIQKKFKKIRDKSTLYTLIIVAVYAAADELHQLYIPGRDCQLGDWIADFLAAIIATVAINFIFKHLTNKSSAQAG